MEFWKKENIYSLPLEDTNSSYKRVETWKSFCQNISIWESKTTNDNADFLYFDQHGNLVIFGKDDSILWSAGIGQNAEKLVMQDDGNVVLYKDDGRSVWATGTNDKCHSDKG